MSTNKWILVLAIVLTNTILVIGNNQTFNNSSQNLPQQPSNLSKSNATMNDVANDQLSTLPSLLSTTTRRSINEATMATSATKTSSMASGSTSSPRTSSTPTLTSTTTTANPKPTAYSVESSNLTEIKIVENNSTNNTVSISVTASSLPDTIQVSTAITGSNNENPSASAQTELTKQNPPRKNFSPSSFFNNWTLNSLIILSTVSTASLFKFTS